MRTQIDRSKFKQTETRLCVSGDAGKIALGGQIGEIPGRWRKICLGDVIDIKHGFAFKGQFFSDEPTEDILLTPGNFRIGGGFKMDKFKYYRGKYPKEYVLNEGDIIITMTDLSKKGDTLGYPARVPLSNGVRYLHNQRLGLVEFKSNQIDKDFLYWQLRTKNYQRFIVNSASGSTVKHTAPSRIRDYDFYAPSSLKKQRAIAKILSDLDDKIELNNQMNKTFESLAQAIFNRWFMDEDKDSIIGKLGDILEVIESGSRPKGGIDPSLAEGIPSIGAESIDGIGFYDYSKTKYITPEFFNIMNRGIVKDYDVLVYKDGAYIGRKSMFGKGFPYEKCCVNEHVFILRSNNRANQFFLYFLLNQGDLKQFNTNSAQPGLNQESVRSLRIIIPNKIKVDRFGEAIKPLIDGIFFNCNQARILSELRDSLLPRLMSGKVRVA